MTTTNNNNSLRANDRHERWLRLLQVHNLGCLSQSRSMVGVEHAMHARCSNQTRRFSLLNKGTSRSLTMRVTLSAAWTGPFESGQRMHAGLGTRHGLTKYRAEGYAGRVYASRCQASTRTVLAHMYVLAVSTQSARSKQGARKEWKSR